jgi:D-tyrosyl-tRNA(Tyr) deacylase
VIAVLQRASEASVEVEGAVVGKIGRGIVVLAAVLAGDRREDAIDLAEKIADYRIFEDDGGKTNLSVAEVGGSVLLVSQFTLAADGSKGRRPSFDRAAPPEAARELLEALANKLRERGIPVETGRFGTSMRVQLVNDGPATFVLERPQRKTP